MTDKYLIQVSKIISVLFKPFYFPVIAFIVLLLFSYMSLLPLSVKLTVLVIVYVFTVVLPLLSIYLYRKINGWTRHQASRRTRRLVPYILSMMCYGCCLYVMTRMRMPHFMNGILVGALAIQLVCTIINNWFKISTHSAAAGGVIGALLAFSFLFSFDPTWWLCLTIVIAGAVGSSRIVLRQHTLSQVGVGALVGFFCGFISILYV